MKVLRYIILCLALLLLSCKTDKVERPDPILQNTQPKNVPAPKAQQNPQQKDITERVSNREASPNEIATQRAQALAIINHRLKSDSESYAIMEADTWEYEFVYNKEMSKPGEYAGIWLDFKPDHTYEYGKNNIVEGAGKYNYSFERGEVVMVDNNTTKKPQEWTVKHADEIMIMIGTATYNDNHIQQKLLRKPDSIRG